MHTCRPVVGFVSTNADRSLFSGFCLDSAMTGTLELEPQRPNVVEWDLCRRGVAGGVNARVRARQRFTSWRRRKSHGATWTGAKRDGAAPPKPVDDIGRCGEPRLAICLDLVLQRYVARTPQ